MSSKDIARMGKLRQVLRLCAQGKGIASAIVEAFGSSLADAEREMVRRILLGMPAEQATASLITARDASWEVLLYLVKQSKVDAVEASRRADRLSSLFERWAWRRRQRLVEEHIMETRSIMVSAVLGGVTAMISAVAPVLASFQLTLGAPPPVPTPSYLGVLFVVPAASFLGYFFSPRRAYVNLAVSVAAYALAAYFFAPLLSSF